MANSDEITKTSFDESEGKTRNTIEDPNKKAEDCAMETNENSDSSGQPMPTQEEEEAALKKKYGGMMPKRPSLISKDHERAFFDSADWALGKGAPPGQKPKNLVEALRPKLQPTPQPHRSRRLSHVAHEGESEGEDATPIPSEDKN